MVKVVSARKVGNMGWRFENSTIVPQCSAYFEFKSLGRRQGYVGYGVYWGERAVFCDCDWIHDGV
jgi:hypothetical protein